MRILRRFWFISALIIVQLMNLNASAQDVVVVDDATLLSEIEKKADVAMKDKSWSITNLRTNLKDLKATDRVKTQLPKAGVKLLASEEIYEKCAKGVIMVGTYYNCGRCDKMHTGLSSGVVLNEDGVCMTNYHVLKGIIESTKSSLSKDSMAFVGTIDGKIYNIVDVLSYSKNGDVAIFKIDTRGELLTAIPLGMPAKTGAEVHAITHPDGRHYFYSKGTVSRNVNYANRGADRERMEISADYAKGSSGCPILDSYGNLVGMVSTTFSVYADKVQEKNIQMVVKSTIPVRIIKRLFN